jgi:uncharacterized membrane protein YqjE
MEVEPVMNGTVYNNRSLADILAELKNEVQEFMQTRIELLRRELNDKVQAVKAALPLLVMGIIFLSTAFTLLSFALVSLLATWIGGDYRWFFGFLIVGFFWGVVGAIAALAAKQHLAKKGVMPKRTVEVLSGDKVWLQREARNIL